MAKVLISEKVNPIGPNLIAANGHEAIQMPSIELADLQKYIKDADALLVRILPITRELMESAPHLKIISKHGVGVDNIDLNAAKDLGIVVTTTPDANGQSVAEHTLSLMLAIAKNIVPVSNAYRDIGFSAKNYKEGMELFGKTLGIIGCGKIGSRVAKMCHNGFNMKVLVYDPYITSVPEGCELIKDRDRLFEDADVVTVHCYLSSETNHCIGKHELALMKPTAIFLNCARGPIVEETALIKALEDNKIAGAGLDVTESEPLDPASPLFAMKDRVILTPHYAPSTREAATNVSRIAAENIINFLAGKGIVGQKA